MSNFVSSICSLPSFESEISTAMFVSLFRVPSFWLCWFRFASLAPSVWVAPNTTHLMLSLESLCRRHLDDVVTVADVALTRFLFRLSHSGNQSLNPRKLQSKFLELSRNSFSGFLSWLVIFTTLFNSFCESASFGKSQAGNRFHHLNFYSRTQK